MRSINHFPGITSLHVKCSKLIKTIVLILTLLPLAGWGQTASSEAYGAAVEVQLDLLGVGFDEAVLPPTPRVSGQGSSSYGPFEDDFTGGVSMDTLNTLAIDMGILSSATAYDAAARSVTAEGSVEDTYILAVIPALADLVIQADSLISQSEITGTCSDLQINASSTLLNAQLTVGDQNLGITENPPPNTVMDLSAVGLDGVSIILNEQIISGDGLHDLSVVTNAMHIVFTVDLFLAQLTGDIVLGASSAAIGDCASADISMSMTATPDPVTEGESLTHTINVNNAGPDTATNLVITDLFPTALSIDSVSSSPGTSCAMAGQQLICDIASLAAASTASVVVVTTPVAPGEIVNTAVVTQETDDPDSSNNSATTTTQVEPVTPVADLSMALSASSDTVTVGEMLSYTIQVNNAGPDAATNFVIDDLIPDALSIQSVTADQGVACTQSGQQVTCTGASLPAADTVAIVINTVAGAEGSITNSASVSQDADDPDSSNNSASIITQIDPAPLSADLGMTMTASSNMVMVGDPLSFTIQITNAGPDTASDFVITDQVPPALQIGPIIASFGLNCFQSGQLVTCSGSSLDAGSSVSVNINTTAVSSGSVVNTATVDQSTNDPDSSNNSASISVQIDPEPSADMAMTMTASGAQIEVGEALNYTIQVSNFGPDEAASVVINDSVPTELTIESVNASSGVACSQSGQQVNCSAASIPASTTVIVTIETTAVATGTITNTASVSQDTADPDSSNNQASATTRVDPAPEPQADLHVEFSPPLPESAERGQLFEIFVIMTNEGPATAEQPLLDFDIPMTANAEQVFTDNDAQCNVSEFNITCLSPDMASGEQTNVRIIVELDIPGEDQTFTATVSSPTSDPDPGDNVAADSIDITEKQ